MNMPLQSALYMLFTGDDHGVYLCSSTDGTTWNGSRNQINFQYSCSAPAILAFDNMFWAAFFDRNSNELLVCTSPDGVNWSPPISMGVSGSYPIAPAFALFNRTLWLAFIDGNNNINIASTSDGVTWSGFNQVTQGAGWGLSLATFNEKLFMAYTDDNNNVMVGSSSDGASWSFSNVGVTSMRGPAICKFQDKLYVAYSVDAFNVGVWVISSTDGATWENPVWTNQYSGSPLAMCEFNQVLYVFFTSTDTTSNGMFPLYFSTSTDGIEWPTLASTDQTTLYGGMGSAVLGQEIVQGTIVPKYQILSVMYAPPGCTNGTPSSVTYGTQNETGTKISASSSFQDGVTISAGVNVGILSSGGSFGYTDDSTDSSSIKATKLQDISFTFPASSEAIPDGIHHKHDLFCLCLNPQVEIYIDNFDNVQWTMGFNGQAAITAWVEAGWLMNPTTMPSNIQSLLNSAGLTQSDYTQILSTNPFVSGGTPDPDRYLLLNETFTYAQDVPLQSLTISKDQATTTTQTTKTSYSVSFDISVGPPIVTGSLKSNFTWTNSSSNESETNSSSSASFTLNPPSSTYSGSAELYVYWDNIYKSFAFSLTSLFPS